MECNLFGIWKVCFIYFIFFPNAFKKNISLVKIYQIIEISTKAAIYIKNKLSVSHCKQRLIYKKKKKKKQNLKNIVVCFVNKVDTASPYKCFGIKYYVCNILF